jgi:alkaline phosphatase D
MVPNVGVSVIPGEAHITHGVQSGDVSTSCGVVWARADRTSRMIVEISPTESFRKVWRYEGPSAVPQTDFTAQTELYGLAPGEEFFYRVIFEDEYQPGRMSEPVVGRFKTAPTWARDVSFVWSGDTVGQGWGINPDIGGMTIYETMRTLRPDFFIHSGDTIYADDPLEERVALPDGTVWRNIVTEEKSKVAETLEEFRGNHRYNLMDDNLRRFNADVPVFAQWDDHETLNNWYPGEILDDPQYTVRDVDTLAYRANIAFHEYLPVRRLPQEAGRIYRKVSYGPLLDVFFLDMRSYRGPNTTNDQPVPSSVTDFLGQPQLEWLKGALANSEATWKVIASDMPISLVVDDEKDAAGTTFEAVANDDDGPALGRELEIAELLSSIKWLGVKNVVWFTADVHYTAAHHYDPSRAAFKDFNPFWEFVSGPLNSGTFGPNDLDGTFGPTVAFQKYADTEDQPPSAGLQFFGHTIIDGGTCVMTVNLKDTVGQTLYSVNLQPEQD